MSQQILQINFNYGSSAEEFRSRATTVANHFASFPGLLWKIWLFNEQANEAGGLYLFQDEASVQAYLKSPLFQHGPASSAFSNLSVKQFSTLQKPGEITHAPVRMLLED